MNYEREIDSDEGREIRAPFFTEALPCESCGAPCDERRIAPWDTSLQVGTCCYHHEELPTCETLWTALSRCESVAAVSLAMSIHLAECPVCQAERTRVVNAEVPRKESASVAAAELSNRLQDALKKRAA